LGPAYNTRWEEVVFLIIEADSTVLDDSMSAARWNRPIRGDREEY
jgi:hypothetical protein